MTKPTGDDGRSAPGAPTKTIGDDAIDPDLNSGAGRAIRPSVPLSHDPPIAGRCDSRFDPVGDAFAENFLNRGESGAGLVVMVDRQTVVDLYGGYTDAAATRPWRPDTLVNAFSVGKPFAALCIHALITHGRVELDRPVGLYWPEFSHGSKHTITVRQVLSHQAGLPALRRPLSDGAMLDWSTMTSALAQETPWWEPGTRHGYHVNTFGYLLGEIVRRRDGRSLGAFLRDEVTRRCGADVFIGVPRREHARIAHFQWPAPPPDPPPTDIDDQALMQHNAYYNPPGLSGAGWVNTAAWRRAEIPSTNAHATAAGVAMLYSALGAHQLIPEAVLAEATTEASYGDDAVLGRVSRFGLGFQLTHPERPLGPNARTFGHFGAGGSLGFYDPDASVAFGYVSNQIGSSWQNPRNRSLLAALYSCL